VKVFVDLVDEVLHITHTKNNQLVRLPRRPRSWLSSASLLTPSSTVLLEKLTVPQLVQKFPAFYVNAHYHIFTSALRLSLS